MDIEKQIGLLGFRVVDKVTGFKGVVTSVCFDIYGCVHVLIMPATGENGK